MLLLPGDYRAVLEIGGEWVVSKLALEYDCNFFTLF